MGDAGDRIRNTIARYSQLCDDGRFDEWSNLFTSDARFHVMGRTHEGPAAIRSFIEAGQPPERRGRHVVTNTVLDVDDLNGTARGWTDYLFVDPAFSITNLGRYHDELVLDRSDAQWRFSLREIVFLGASPEVAQPVPGAALPG